MPIHMRLPKRGFNNYTKKKYTEITTGNLQSYIDSGLLKSDKEITENDFVSSCKIKKSSNGFKLLNKGELKSKINLSISKATKSSIELIENLGGTVNILETPKEKRNRKITKKSKQDNVAVEENETIENESNEDSEESETEENNNPENKEGI